VGLFQIHIHVCVRTYIYAKFHQAATTRRWACTYIQTCIHAHNTTPGGQNQIMSMFTHTYIQTFIHTYNTTRTRLWACTYINTYKHAYIHTYKTTPGGQNQIMGASISNCINIRRLRAHRVCPRYRYATCIYVVAICSCVTCTWAWRCCTCLCLSVCGICVCIKACQRDRCECPKDHLLGVYYQYWQALGFKICPRYSFSSRM
jgi:hypothetical protein